ncbi:hypothetical protein [Flavobacterium sp. CLA17]|uniref:hypothetical protein n=1 Tax=Flavobacterium sp. CLA17 TaxID=2724135 RepID=UPI001491E471|nr:hypothetical protein [Flavobacterium sp. CLA17]QSB28639.1 hypothetical protein HAV12_007870 [Flavobacterium sp. CLA17]
MNLNWSDVNWIFEPEGSLRDIYIKNVRAEDWIVLIDHLNQNYNIRYGPSIEKNSINKIDKEYILQYFSDETAEMETKSASIFIDKIMINLHFFSDEEIEFDIDPKEINSNIDLKTIIGFMNDMSQILKKEVILTGEGESEYALITVDYGSKKILFVTKK